MCRRPYRQCLISHVLHGRRNRLDSIFRTTFSRNILCTLHRAYVACLAGEFINYISFVSLIQNQKRSMHRATEPRVNTSRLSGGRFLKSSFMFFSERSDIDFSPPPLKPRVSMTKNQKDSEPPINVVNKLRYYRACRKLLVLLPILLEALVPYTGVCR